MREIKFRALKDDMSNCSFVYGDLIYDLGIPRIKEFSLEMKFTTCIEGTEGQYTGLKDKNGKEIYENDLLKVPEYFFGDYLINSFNGVVRFDNGMYEIKGIETSLELDKESIHNYGIEIIGNIHENLELFKL